MRKKISFAVVLALAVVLGCSLLFAGCGKEPETFNITWPNEANVTITADGFDTLPTSVEEGTVVTFSVTPKTGWEVVSVTGATKSGDKYTFTANKTITVGVRVKEIVSSIDVTAPTLLTYYAGETVKPEGMSVKVNYATGRSDTTDNYNITYQNGEAFAIGDTKFTVSYSGFTKDIDLTDKVVGKATISLEGGTLASGALDAFKDFTNYSFDEEKGIISWTFDKAIEADIALPEPTKTVNGSPFPFKNYSGVTGNKIAKGTAVSLDIKAVYEANLLTVESIEFRSEDVTENEATVNVPYLVIKGKFVAATEAYLYLYEGNDKVELKGDTITKTAGNDDFELKFDLRKLFATGYSGKWMDIKFRATFGERVETQEINLENYDDEFTNLNDFAQAELEKDGSKSWYVFSFKVHTPDGTTARNLKVVYESGTPRDYKYREGRISLKNVEFDVPKAEGEGTEKKTLPAMVIPVQYIDLSGEATKETVTAFAEAYIKNMEDMSNWSAVAMQKKVTVNDDFSCVIALSVENVQQGATYIFHYADGSNVASSKIDATPLPLEGSDTLGYKLVNLSGQGDSWKNGLLNVHLVDITGRTHKTNLNAATLVAEGDKVYMVVTGTSEKYTAAMEDELKANVIKDGYVDAENASDSSDKTDLSDKVTFEFNAETGNYTIKVDVTSLAAGHEYWMHLGTGIDVRNTTATDGAPVSSVTVGGNTYRFVGKNQGNWTAYRLEVVAAA